MKGYFASLSTIIITLTLAANALAMPARSAHNMAKDEVYSAHAMQRASLSNGKNISSTSYQRQSSSLDDADDISAQDIIQARLNPSAE